MKSFWWSAAPAVIAVACISAPVAAQSTDTAAAPRAAADASTSAEATAAGDMNEIIVTARKRAERLQDVPIAVTALDDRLLEEQKTRNIEDVQGLTPNFVIDTAGGVEGIASIYIRGIGTQEIEQSVDPAVGVVIDGVYLANPVGNLPYTFDFEQVEVLRGPQGSLFGKNTTGGVLNIRRKRPSFDPGGEVEVTLGSYDRREFKGAVTSGIVDGLLAARLSVAKLDRDGFKYNIARQERAGGTNLFVIQPTLLFTPAENFSAILRYEHQRNRADGAGAQNLAGTGNAVNPAPELSCAVFKFCGPFGTGKDIDRISLNLDEEFRYDLDAVTAQADWTLGAGTVTNIFGYRTYELFTANDPDATPAPVFGSIRDQDFSQYSNELRFTSDFSDRFNFVAGAYYFQDQYTNFQRTLSVLPLFGPTAPPGTEARLRQAQRRKSWAAFGEANLDVTDTLTLTLGGRYTWERKRFLGRSFLGLPTGVDVPISTAPGKETWNDFSPKGSITWKPTNDVTAYYSYSQGFRSGGFNGRNATPASIGPYDPEEVKQHEVGLKTSLFDRSLRFNLAAFHIKYDDKQEESFQPDPLLGSVTVTSNASSATLQGIEAEFSWRPAALDGFGLDGNVGYLKADYDNFCADLNGPLLVSPADTPCGTPTPLGAAGTIVPTDNSGLQMRRTPKWQFGVSARYEFEVGRIKPTVWTAYRWTDDYFSDLRNDPRSLYKSEGLLDVGLDFNIETKNGGQYRASLFARNLTNEQQLSSIAVVPGVIAFGVPTEGRTFGLEFAASF